MKLVERLPNEGYRRVVLPISSGVRCSRDSAVLMTVSNQINRFYPERLLIQDGADWRIQGMGVDGAPWIRERGVHGQSFAPAECGALPRKELRAGDRISLGVTYQGASPEGASFMGCFFGSTQAASSIVSARPTEDLCGIAALHVVADLPARHAEVSRVRIPIPSDCWSRRLALACPGDWIVNDVLVDDQSILLPDGDMFSGSWLPGELFSGSTGSRGVLRIGRLAAGSSLVVEATYVGHQEQAFLGCVLQVHARPDESDSEGGLSTFVSLSSGGVSVLAGGCMQITAKPLIPRGYVFRPQHLMFREAHKWVIQDLGVGNLAQFAAWGDVPGEAFAWNAVDNDVVTDVLSKEAGKLRLTLMNVEPGEPSECVSSPVVAGVGGTLFRVASS
jgi:hypothetical protein